MITVEESKSEVNMKLIISLAFTLIACDLTATQEIQESTVTPQPIIDLAGIGNAIRIKHDLVSRIIRLLYASSTPVDQQRNDSSLIIPLINRAFRRLNIFGLQAPPDAPPRSIDGSPLSGELNEAIPDILHPSKKPEPESGPNFFVVDPQRDEDENAIPSSSDAKLKIQYPKLELVELIGLHQDGSSLPEKLHQGLINYQQPEEI